MRIIRLILTTAVCAFAAGCGTINPMAFDKSSTAIDTKEKSIVLMTLDVSRSDGSRFTPEPLHVTTNKPGAQNNDDRQFFRLRSDDAIQENGRNVYLLRLALAPGNYRLTEIIGMARAFPVNGFFNLPLGMDIHVKPNSVLYVGRVTGKLRNRVGNEFRAGPLLPLIDQAIAGMSGSTWDISSDNLNEKDLASFRVAFPILKNVAIDIVPLPPFNRAAAQRLWDGEADGASKPAAAAAP